jgi:hypothetical protein
MNKVIFDILDINGNVVAKGFTYTKSQDVQNWMETEFDWKQYSLNAYSFIIKEISVA